MRPPALSKVAYFAAAVLAVALPIPFVNRRYEGAAWCVSFGLSAVWAAGVVWAFVKSGRQAHPLLWGLPLVLYRPAVALFVVVACRFGNDCL
jgi:hypothetical protein